MDTSTTTAQLRSAFNKKVQRGIFQRGVARYLHPDIAEERLQEGISLTWRLYHDRFVDRGEVVPDAVLVVACRRRACERHRSVVVANGKARSRDVFDHRNFVAGHVRLLDLDGILDDEAHPDGDREINTAIGFAQPWLADPTTKIVSAIDLEAWLDGLAKVDRRVVELRGAGCSIDEVAADAKVSSSTVKDRLKRLGRDLSNRMREEVAAPGP